MDLAAFIKGIDGRMVRGLDGEAAEAAVGDWEEGEVTRNVRCCHLDEIVDS